MSLLNFPTNPSVNDTYTIGTNTWVWNGSAWVKYSYSTLSPIQINTGTVSTSTNTGALVITGGVGIGGSVNVGSTSTINGAQIITTATLDNFVKQTIVYAGTDTAVATASTSGYQYVTIWNTSTLQTVTDRGFTTTNQIHITNSTQSTGTGTGALIVDGGVSVGGRIYAESIKIADTIMDSGQILVNTTETVVVDAYSISQFRSAKYLIQIDEGSGPTADFQVIEILLLVDNAGTVFATEYGVITSNGEMGEFAADVGIDNMVRLYFTAYYATNKVIKILRTAMAV